MPAWLGGASRSRRGREAVAGVLRLGDKPAQLGSERFAGLELVDHAPETVGLAAFDDLQGLEIV